MTRALLPPVSESKVAITGRGEKVRVSHAVLGAGAVLARRAALGRGSHAERRGGVVWVGGGEGACGVVRSHRMRLPSPRPG